MVPSDPISSPLTTGMHGIELRDQERRTLRLSAPLRTFFTVRRINAFKHAACCLSLGTGSLVTAFRSPATVAASQQPPFRGQSFRTCYFAPFQIASVPARPFGSAVALRFAPVAAASTPQARCTSTTRFGQLRSPSPLPLGILTSLRIKAFNGVCCLPVRLTNPPDLPSLPATLSFFKCGCRITVPGSLRFRRLAVPQTSWNLLHYALEAGFGQTFFVCNKAFSSIFNCLIFSVL
jgi:hypothetical protein